MGIITNLYKAKRYDPTNQHGRERRNTIKQMLIEGPPPLPEVIADLTVDFASDKSLNEIIFVQFLDGSRYGIAPNSNKSTRFPYTIITHGSEHMVSGVVKKNNDLPMLVHKWSYDLNGLACANLESLSYHYSNEELRSAL